MISCEGQVNSRKEQAARSCLPRHRTGEIRSRTSLFASCICTNNYGCHPPLSLSRFSFESWLPCGEKRLPATYQKLRDIHCCTMVGVSLAPDFDEHDTNNNQDNCWCFPVPSSSDDHLTSPSEAIPPFDNKT